MAALIAGRSLGNKYVGLHPNGSSSRFSFRCYADGRQARSVRSSIHMQATPAVGTQPSVTKVAGDIDLHIAQDTTSPQPLRNESPRVTLSAPNDDTEYTLTMNFDAKTIENYLNMATVDKLDGNSSFDSQDLDKVSVFAMLRGANGDVTLSPEEFGDIAKALLAQS